MSWRWLSAAAVQAIHAEQIAEHGGAPGLRDAAAFLLLNGSNLTASEQEVTTTFWRLADGTLAEPELADWFCSEIAEVP